ncbi:FAD-dependent oxidoreductase [Guyparkeria halophila]|uniref:FAD-dependent oxidoreductase n=1 Tax=Guyparkeria halophila TaxID=47960 RepID=A0ABZ0YYK6_9GAMM|nr:FAD-dependent oxidoreductase [Guyparkeria halophila]WQH17277.1 FAD-dependent oxidoreductase [Guyparkeria halophila]
MKPRLVVIGNGMAGARLLEELVARDAGRHAITVFGAEPHGNYNRIMLSPVLAGEKTVAEIMLNPREWYARHDITLHLGDPVVAIDRTRREVTSRAGVTVPYDQLVFATGSRPWLPEIPGIDLPGVGGFRDLADVETLQARLAEPAPVVILGGGLLGLEAAAGLAGHGIDVTVVHRNPVLMNRQLDDAAAAILRQALEARGVRFILGTQAEAIEGSERVEAVRLDDGRRLPAATVLFTIGIQPAIALAREAGLDCGRGIRVDDQLRSSDPAIHALGECIEHDGRTYGLVAPIWEQARVLAGVLTTGRGRYRDRATSTRLKVTGIDVFSAGRIDPAPGEHCLRLRDPQQGIYKKLILRDDNVVGVVLVGDVADGGWFFDLLGERRDISAFRERLLFGERFCEPDDTTRPAIDSPTENAA